MHSLDHKLDVFRIDVLVNAMPQIENVAFALTRDSVALQGNLDPGVLYGSKSKIREEVQRVLESYGEGERHIFNLGHGIHQHIDPENVDFMIETVHELSPAFHR